MGKTCTELFAGIDCTVIGNADDEVGGIAYRSDRVQPGDAFFCIVGLTADGHSFAQDAIDRGAKVLVVERKVYLADATDVTEVVVKDTRKAMAVAAANFYDHPSQGLALVGITGTNGKTTTTYLVEHIARVAGKRTGVIGTVGVRIGDEQEKSAHTTPESPDLQQLFARMRDARCDVVAMEVSSHALDLERTWGTPFAVTAFSNLTQDHLDYHHTFEAYFEAKARLFSKDYPARRVICIDDKWGTRASAPLLGGRGQRGHHGLRPVRPDPSRGRARTRPRTPPSRSTCAAAATRSTTRSWAASTWRTSCARSASGCSWASRRRSSWRRLRRPRRSPAAWSA